MRYFLQLAYKGTHFHGWQKQQNAATIQDFVDKALETILKHEIESIGSGRTDTGVHARNQFVHFDTQIELTSFTHIKKINALMPYEIVPLKLFKAQNSEASARFDAINRSYRYEASDFPNPFWRELVTTLRKTPDIALMNEAAKLLLQHDDFETFSKVSDDTLHTRCDIQKAIWHKNEEGKFIFDITANRFLRGMVRLIVGNLLEVGNEKITVEEFKQRMLAKNRQLSAPAAPADGLYLQEVTYPTGLLTEV